MLNLKDVYRIQSEYSVATSTFKESQIVFADYVSQCRLYISQNLPEEYTNGGWDDTRKRGYLVDLVSRFITDHQVKVKDYTSDQGIVNTEMLMLDLTNTILGLAVIDEALNDPKVDEIQINDKNTVFVVKGGVTVPYVDSKGRVMQFSSNEEIHTMLNKILDDGTGSIPQFTEGEPLLNAKTARDQYRVNAVHYVANTMDKPPYNYPITTVVIRKFKEVKLTLDDIVRTGSCTAKMGRLINLLGQAELKLFCVGATGSGKTTLLNIIAGTIPIEKRLILVQNPTEISFFERDEYGRNLRNVVHWEVNDLANYNTVGKISSATMPNLISNTLRATPDVILVGEARTPDEFYQIYRAMRTGHKLLGTFHADSGYDAVGRFATELSTITKGANSESVKLICDTVNIIIAQRKFDNGDRRITEISEVVGMDKDGEPKLNTLFKFVRSGKVEKYKIYMDTGERVPEGEYIEGRATRLVKKVLGEFKQVGVLSDRIKETFFDAGIDIDELQEFCNEEDIGKVA